jgi:hypothetical protein
LIYRRGVDSYRQMEDGHLPRRNDPSRDLAT